MDSAETGLDAALVKPSENNNVLAALPDDIDDRAYDPVKSITKKKEITTTDQTSIVKYHENQNFRRQTETGSNQRHPKNSEQSSILATIDRVESKSM
jgi:hypothetical protein